MKENKEEKKKDTIVGDAKTTEIITNERATLSELGREFIEAQGDEETQKQAILNSSQVGDDEKKQLLSSLATVQDMASKIGKPEKGSNRKEIKNDLIYDNPSKDTKTMKESKSEQGQKAKENDEERTK